MLDIVEGPVGGSVVDVRDTGLEKTRHLGRIGLALGVRDIDRILPADSEFFGQPRTHDDLEPALIQVHEIPVRHIVEDVGRQDLFGGFHPHQVAGPGKLVRARRIWAENWGE